VIYSYNKTTEKH